MIHRAGGGTFAVTKGAPEMVLPACAMADAEREKALAEAGAMAEGALRASGADVAVASSGDEHPERDVALAPEVGGLGEDLLDRRPVVRMVLAIHGGVREGDGAAVLAQPVAILEHVGQRVEVVAEVIGQRERAFDCYQVLLGLSAGMLAGGGPGQSVATAGVFARFQEWRRRRRRD